MYGYSKKANYFRLIIDRKNFNKIHEKKINEIHLKATPLCHRALAVENEFVRFIYKDWYMDIAIRKIVQRDLIILHLGTIIDYAKPNK